MQHSTALEYAAGMYAHICAATGGVAAKHAADTRRAISELHWEQLHESQFFQPHAGFIRGSEL